jgi:hypothetical protein
LASGSPVDNVTLTPSEPAPGAESDVARISSDPDTDSSLLALNDVNPAAALASVASLVQAGAPEPLPASLPSEVLPTFGASFPASAGSTDAVFAASSPGPNDDGGWVFAPLSPNSLDAI